MSSVARSGLCVVAFAVAGLAPVEPAGAFELDLDRPAIFEAYGTSWLIELGPGESGYIRADSGGFCLDADGALRMIALQAIEPPHDQLMKITFTDAGTVDVLMPREPFDPLGYLVAAYSTPCERAALAIEDTAVVASINGAQRLSELLRVPRLSNGAAAPGDTFAMDLDSIDAVTFVGGTWLADIEPGTETTVFAMFLCFDGSSGELKLRGTEYAYTGYDTFDLFVSATKDSGGAVALRTADDDTAKLLRDAVLAALYSPCERTPSLPDLLVPISTINGLDSLHAFIASAR